MNKNIIEAKLLEEFERGMFYKRTMSSLINAIHKKHSLKISRAEIKDTLNNSLLFRKIRGCKGEMYAVI